MRSPRTAAAGAQEAGLRISAQTPDRVRGAFGLGDIDVTFRAHRVADGRASATLQPPHEAITVTRDLNTGQAAFSGNDTVVSKAERRAIRGLAESLSTWWKDSDLPGHSDLVARVINMMSEAPDGVPLADRKIEQLGERWTDVPPSQQALDGRDCPDGTRQRAGADNCQVDSGEGIRYFETCTSTNRMFGHDWDDH